MSLLTIVILGIVVLLAIAAIVLYLLWKRTQVPLACRKALHNGMSVVEVTAHSPIDELRVEDRVEKERMQFVRAGLKAGERVEFVYPASLQPAKLTCRQGMQVREIEVPLT